MNKSPFIPVNRRIYFWAAAWLVAAIATTFPPPNDVATVCLALLMYQWLFPLGLIIPFAPSLQPMGSHGLILTAGWFLYLGLSVYGLTRQSRTKYFLAYAVLTVLLILNVTGCRILISHFHMGGC